MKYCESVLDLIGDTPLVKLSRMVGDSMATVLCKMETRNPAGSIKDRMAVHMVRAAEEQGLLGPGGTVVESTSGNTGLGLAMAAAVRGYHCVCTIPDKMSKEKIDMLKAYGVEVIVTPTDLPHDHPESYVEVAKRIARERPNAWYADQYYNMKNPEAHYLTTGPEIWADTDGKIDALIGGIGTGGTISGAGKYLKEKAAEVGRQVRVVCPDPIGSIYADTFHKREVRDPRVYAVEGIGHDFMVGTLDFSVIDDVIEVSDRDSFLTARRMAREEGIFTGGSAGTAVFGALQEARRLGPGKLVVVLIPDDGGRYLSKCFDDEWMKDKGFLERGERVGTVNDLLEFKGRDVEFAESDESIAHIAARMSAKGISQMPVRTSVAGKLEYRMIHEADLLHGLLHGRCKPDGKVALVSTELHGRVSPGDSTLKVEGILDSQDVAVVFDGDEIVGIVSKIDVVRFLASRS